MAHFVWISHIDVYKRQLEGYLYPDTYEFYLEENEAHAIRRFLDNFQEKFTSKYEARAKELGMTVDEIVTLSLIHIS